MLRTRITLVAAALATPLVLATCSSSAAPTAPAGGSYTITLRPYGAALPAVVQVALDSAVARWERIITSPLPNASIKVPAAACSASTPADTETSTGMVVMVTVRPIDGPGRTLAQSGPCLVRQSDGLTALGIMIVDSADVDTLVKLGALNSVVLHEMAHVLGFGSLWGPPDSSVKANCLQLPSSPPGTVQDTYFSCAKAIAQFNAVGGTSYTGGNKVPVENCGTSPYTYPTCGTGTVNSHWRESVFGNELMVGFLPSDPRLSVVTIGTMEDLGYAVSYAAADSYVHTFTAPPVVAPPRLSLGDDVLHGPIYVVDERGSVVRVVRPR